MEERSAFYIANARWSMHKKYSFFFLAASVLGLGKARFAPGTAASLFAGVPCFLAVGYSSWVFQLYVAAFLFAFGCWVSGKWEQELGKTDPGEVVIDELCGFLIAMIGHPVSFASILAGFAFFRLFDIWKPWPLRDFQDKLGGGLAIMADDVGAGVYANILGIIVLSLLNAW